MYLISRRFAFRHVPSVWLALKKMSSVCRHNSQEIPIKSQPSAPDKRHNPRNATRPYNPYAFSALKVLSRSDKLSVNQCAAIRRPIVIGRFVRKFLNGRRRCQFRPPKSQRNAMAGDIADHRQTRNPTGDISMPRRSVTFT
jgi:hypothetical protein